MTLADLTVDVDHLDRDRLLDDWRWLIGSAKRLVLVSAIGDAFLQDTDDGAIHLLDTAAGSCAVVARDAGEFRSLLEDPAWVTDHLEVHFSLTGQIHQQVQSLPPGTPITEIRLGPEQG